MIVHFIGAGPGAPDLLTLRGRDLIAASPVCLYAGALVPKEILRYAADDARIVNTEHLSLDEIEREFLVASARNVDVARLHSGDLAMWSAMGEQIARLRVHNIAYDITPGVPAFAAAAAALGQEITRPYLAQSLILTRTAKRSTPLPASENLAELSKSGASLALHLSIGNIDQIVADLAPTYGLDAPVVVVARASWADECLVRATLATLEEKVRQAGIERNAIIFIGPAFAQSSENSESYLYSQTRSRIRE